MHSTAVERTKTRILLIENDAWDASLVQEALGELEERPQDSLLPLPLDLFHAETVDEALAAMRGQRSELVLLDLAAHQPGGLHAFLKTRQAMPETPIVILAKQEEEHLALAAMREGAAGYVLKEEMDCLPLARSLRAALDRHQAVQHSQHAAMVDEFTCLTSRASFLPMAGLVRQLAGRWGKTVSLARVKLAAADKTGQEDAAAIALLQTADMLREVFPEADLLARTGEREFALLFVERAVTEAGVRRAIADWLSERQEKLVIRHGSGYAVEAISPLPEGAPLEAWLAATGGAPAGVAK